MITRVIIIYRPLADIPNLPVLDTASGQQFHHVHQIKITDESVVVPIVNFKSESQLSIGVLVRAGEP